MDNPKSSFRGNVSYIGPSRADKDLTMIVIASGREFFVRSNDPGLKGLRVTSGSKRIFMIVEEIVVGQVYRICAVYRSRAEDVSFVLMMNEHIQQGTLTVKVLAKYQPEYLYKG